jgi:demethylmenaquinone methyltransferase/2-methoxy-6-polyprenyl-1,4-benzoquinol methylase
MRSDAAGRIETLFAAIARRYDGLNSLFSFRRDGHWRRRLARLLPLRSGGRALDVCTGTGDLAIAVARAWPGAAVDALDFSPAMLSLAARKLDRAGLPGRVRLVRGDALALPFPEGTFDAVTVAFGLRNLVDRGRGVGEMLRVLRPGGTLAVLEFAPPERGLRGRAFRAYLRWIIAPLGDLVSRTPGAYSYLFSSIDGFLAPERVVALLSGCGAVALRDRSLTAGVVRLFTARKPAGREKRR